MPRITVGHEYPLLMIAVLLLLPACSLATRVINRDERQKIERQGNDPKERSGGQIHRDVGGNGDDQAGGNRREQSPTEALSDRGRRTQSHFRLNRVMPLGSINERRSSDQQREHRKPD